MATMLEMTQPIEWESAKGSGTEWSRLGKVWMTGPDEGWATFTALPIATMNSKTGKIEYRVRLSLPKSRDDAPRGNGRAQSAPQRDELDDDVPF